MCLLTKYKPNRDVTSMSSKQSGSGSVPDNLPEDFFDSDKKSKKEQQDEITKAMQEWEKEVAARGVELEKELEEEFEMQQNDTNIDELDKQLEQWKRFAELEKRAQELQNKTTNSENVPTKMARDPPTNETNNEDTDMIDGEEDVEDGLFDWRSKGL